MWEFTKPWLKAIEKHILRSGASNGVCDFHETTVDMVVKPYGEGYHTTCNIDVSCSYKESDPCVTREKWSNVEHAVRGIFSNIGQHGPTVNDYTLAGDIMLHTDGRYCCEEEDFEDDEDDDS